MIKTLIQILCFFTILINLFYNLKMLKKGIEKKNQLILKKYQYY